ncbi:TRAP transporter substrate-binding protein [Desulfonatronovibrio magnus]|uniref:TRAP transporter substrate-binding protein n=1 Tax=Desulfonatronovibrio magnus TaxID=698827 RepID=UPI0005EB4A76|nr:TRAP transporter substrate-binding protein [Desulfonatronovibrio magnus]
MKKFHYGIILFLLTLSFLFSGCSSDESGVVPAEHQTFNLSMATFWPSTAFQVAEMHNLWIQEVEHRTDGRVKINLHPGEVLLGAREIYNGVASGAADIGTTCPSYTPGMFPMIEAFELPGFINANATAASAAINEGYKTIRQELDLDEFEDVKVLFLWATGPGNIMSKRPVRTLDDMSGMEIRAVGGTVPSVESLGATTHAMPMSESYLALDQGLVNGILAPNETLRAFRLAEVVDYVTNTPFLYNVAFIKIMNKDTWNSLPQDIQNIFNEMNEEFVITYAQMMDEFSQNILEQAVNEYGIEVIDLSDEEREKWLARLTPVVQNWIDRREQRGHPASLVYEIARDLDIRFSEKYQ